MDDKYRCKPVRVISADTYKLEFISFSIKDAGEILDIDPKEIGFICHNTSADDIIDCLTFEFDSEVDRKKYLKTSYWFRRKRIMSEPMEERCEFDT